MYYIAYGSNINLEQMAYRCPNSKVVGKGFLKRWKLVFNIHADIIYTDNKSDEVPVLIWDIAEEDWANLDRYEGFPKYYVKKEIVTYFTNGKKEKCIAYVMTADRKGFEMPFEEYYDTIETGYWENNIDNYYLRKALKYTYKKEQEMYV